MPATPANQPLAKEPEDSGGVYHLPKNFGNLGSEISGRFDRVPFAKLDRGSWRAVLDGFSQFKKMAGQPEMLFMLNEMLDVSMEEQILLNSEDPQRY